MFNVGNHKVYETMPASMVDLSKCTISAWPVAEEYPEIIDKVTDSGIVVLYNTKDASVMVPENIPWGKFFDEHGICNVVVDVPELTQSILMSLWVMGVIPEAE